MDLSEYDYKAMFSLKGKVSVVTGATGGLGKASCLALVLAGSKLMMISRDEGKLRELKEEIRGLGEVEYITANVIDEEQVERAFKEAYNLFGRIDVLVNSHGINRRIPTLDYPTELWEQVVDVNLKGTFLTCRAAGKYMILRKYGKIINISSTAGSSGYKWGYSAYSPSKAGVDALTRTLAVEWAKYGIRVNAIAPYMIETNLTKKFLESEEIREQVLKEIPLGIIGKPSDIAGAVVYLASPASDWLTGQVIYIDGGYLAH
jgi:NAD(P)-dependent dehydrogenase (short-subunit alcohol dehydrogenase family)